MAGDALRIALAAYEQGAILPITWAVIALAAVTAGLVHQHQPNDRPEP